MNTLPRNLYLAAAVRELDRHAIEDLGIAGIELMTRAGTAAFALLRHLWPQVSRLTLLCGPGNNGGDGFVIARLAHAAGIATRVYLTAAADRLRGDAATAFQALCSAGVEVLTLDTAALTDVLTAAENQPATGAHVIVDALFGTGLMRDIEPQMADCFTRLNALSSPVLAVDIPSGLHADSGRVLGAALQATATISFIGLKTGLFTGQGPDFCGAVYYDDLRVPAAVYEAVDAVAERIDYSTLPAAASALLQQRPRCAHKGAYGHVLVVGGAPGMSGAVRMAAEAAARVGAGLVSVASHPGHAPAISQACPVLMAHDVAMEEQLLPLLQRATVIVVGPGLGRQPWGRACLQFLLDHCIAAARPMIIDADGLNGLAEDPCHYDHWILTPHPGEAARLLGLSTAEIQHDRLAAAMAIQQRYGGVCILKGAGTVIQSAGRTYLCSIANAAMASGGMGDVLSGVIAGLLAQGGTLETVACLGVSVHAQAAVAVGDGQRGVLAMDLLPRLQQLVNPDAQQHLTAG